MFKNYTAMHRKCFSFLYEQNEYIIVHRIPKGLSVPQNLRLPKNSRENPIFKGQELPGWNFLARKVLMLKLSLILSLNTVIK